MEEVLSQPVSERTPCSDPQPINGTRPDGEVLDVAPKQKGLFAEVRPRTDLEKLRKPAAVSARLASPPSVDGSNEKSVTLN